MRIDLIKCKPEDFTKKFDVYQERLVDVNKTLLEVQLKEVVQSVAHDGDYHYVTTERRSIFY
jgi:hypothetical protein